MFLNACIALGVLEEEHGKYANNELSQAFLTPGKAAYLGDALRYSDDLYHTWGNLKQALKSAEVQMPLEKYIGEDLEKTRHFVYAMHNRVLGIGRMMVDLSDRKK